MLRSTYVSIFLALALVASHSKAGPTKNRTPTPRQQNEVEYTFRTATKAWMDLDARIQKSERVIKQNYVTGQMATDQFQSVADSFYTAMSQFLACGPQCIEQDINNFLGTFTNCFSTFQGLVQSAQNVFPGYWNDLFSKSFLTLSDLFAQFFASCFAHGTSFKKIVTQQLFQFFLYTGMEQTVKTLKAWGLP